MTRGGNKRRHNEDILKVFLWCCLGLAIVIVAYDGLLAIGFGTRPAWFNSWMAFAGSGVLTLCAVGTLAWLYAVNQRQFNAHEQLKSRERLQSERLLTVINNINYAVLNITPRGTIKMYNSATLILLDTNDNLNNKNIDAVLKLVDSTGKLVRLSNIVVGHKMIDRDDLIYVLSDGQKINIHLTCVPVRGSYGATEKALGGVIMTLRDITKAKTLDDEKDEFISVVSHELRTPVTIAEGSLSNLQAYIERGISDSAQFKAAVDTAHEQVIFLAKMINDLSTLSRAERDVGADLETIKITELLADLYRKYQPEAKAKGLALDLDLNNAAGSIKVSRLYIEELLQNLVTNAIKYTAHGSVTLSAKTTAAVTEFAVTDTGIGISKPDQKRIFDKFYRSEDYRTRETSGSGLGLYVSNQLANKMGGELTLDSRLNHGSTFTFVLPKNKS
ncbi:PAS domain-containing sensor histidine kinase [Candidatus Saccharibacteria bacterium]|nr:PAS domain-containing sensor histidine kinase [Candidatus Saccharibacteria bacterium]